MAVSIFVKAVPVPRPVAALLAFVAGMVDACTVFGLFGLYVAQVTGSFVLIGVQVVNADIVNVVRTLAIPVFFLSGFVTALLAELAGDGRRALSGALGAELILVTALVGLGIAYTPFAGPNAPQALLASLIGVVAMGVQSAMVRLLMRNVASTNVMTTNTTLAAIELAQWSIAARRARLRPDSAAAQKARGEARSRFAGLWPVLLGFLGGAICGAIGYRWAGFTVLAAAAAILAGLTVWAMRLKPEA
ncbi:MAG: YoaK family protein [Pseudolabrys sp.]